MYMRLSVPSLCITSFGVFNLIHMILNESKKEDGFDEIRYLHFKCSFNALAHGKCELIQIANDYPMVMLIFPFRQLHKSTIQCIFNISHQLSGAVRHPPGHDLYSVCILIDDKLYNDTWNCSAFHKLFRTKFRFNIDEWICDLLHKKCSASIRKMVLHYFHLAWKRAPYVFISNMSLSIMPLWQTQKDCVQMKKKWLNHGDEFPFLKKLI